ncbi:tetratricopeptide repeat protein [Seonamhaeicola sp.]|uniref:tetratricopeptide repeat protein n=1 Tax=Seonamhaeicola sp. TaxID=1912245 RepID=UPI002630F0CE|nr:tetratricopeptide repeat protein [Seonamhaeicola sp.]
MFFDKEIRIKRSELKWWFLLFFISVTSSLVSGQQDRDSIVESLKNQITKTTSDSLRVHYQMELIETIRDYDKTHAREIAEEALKTIIEKGLTSFYFQKRKAEAYNYLGFLNRQQSHFENALENYLKALKISERIRDSVGLARAYHNIGMSFRWQQDYERSKEYFKKAIAIRNRLKDSTRLATSHNMLGVAYYYSLQNDSAMFHYNKARDIYPDELGKSKVNINIATLYNGLGDYEKAIPIYEENLRILKKYKILADVSVTKFNLARIYSEKGQQKRALKYVDEAIAIMQPIRTSYEALARQYQLRSLINQRSGLHVTALADYKQYKILSDSLTNMQRVRRINTLELNYKFQKEKLADSLQYAKEKEIAMAQIELLNHKNKIKQQWIIFGGVGVFLLVLSLIFHHRQRVKFKVLENELLSSEVEHKKKDLKQLAIEIAQNKEWALVLAQKLANVREAKGRKRTNALLSLEEEIKNKIYVDKSTDIIHDEIENLGSSFFGNLKKHFPNLTKTDTRLCALIRMNMGTKQIAMLQNINPASVKMSRNRLRKKLNLAPSDDLKAFLASF